MSEAVSLRDMFEQMARTPTPQEEVLEPDYDAELERVLAQEPSYKQPILEEDKGRIIQFINQVTPYKRVRYRGRDESGKPVIREKIESGDLDDEIMELYEGYVAHNTTFTNFDDRQIRVHEVRIASNKLLARMCKPRSMMTPDYARKLHNAEHVAICRLNQNKNGDNFKFSAGTISAELREVSLGQKKKKGRARSFWGNLTGGEE